MAAKQLHYKLDQDAPFANPHELGGHGAIVLGTPTRCGNMTARIKQFIDQTGDLWAKDALVGKAAQPSSQRPSSMLAKGRR